MMTPLERRKALLWVRANQPATWSSTDGSAPPRIHITELLRDRLIEFSKERRVYDPVTYDLTSEGAKVLA